MKSSLNDRLERFFRANRSKWIPMQRIAQIAGVGGFRNRVTDLRLQRRMKIANRLYRKNGITHSEYLFHGGRRG